MIFNWSGGKDSAMALYYLLQKKDYDIKYLLTSLNKSSERVSMHGFRKTLLYQQVKNIDIPLKKLFARTKSFRRKGCSSTLRIVGVNLRYRFITGLKPSGSTKIPTPPGFKTRLISEKARSRSR